MWVGIQVLLHSVEPTILEKAARHPALEIDAIADLNPSPIQPLKINADGLSPLPITFDQAVNRMQSAGNIYCEGDGSFVVCGNQIADAKNQHTLWIGRDAKRGKILPTADWRFTAPDSPHDSNSKVVWRIEGNLVDGSEHLNHVQMIGFAPVPVWREFLKIFASERAEKDLPCVFQLQQFGIFLDVDDVLNAAS